MDRNPITPEKRRVLEALIRIIDLVIYAAVIVGGVYALIFTPMSVQTELTGWEWLIPVWGSMLLLGGLGGFVGRLTRYWIVEVPSLPLAGVGIGIYFFILGSTAFSSAVAVVATMLILASLLMILRRYVELQIFASEPEDQDFRARVVAMFTRRTRDVVQRNE
jgi:hypothetical protein